MLASISQRHANMYNKTKVTNNLGICKKHPSTQHLELFHLVELGAYFVWQGSKKQPAADASCDAREATGDRHAVFSKIHYLKNKSILS